MGVSAPSEASEGSEANPPLLPYPVLRTRLRYAKQIKLAAYDNPNDSNSNWSEEEMLAMTSTGKLASFETAVDDFGEVLVPLFRMFATKILRDDLTTYRTQDIGNILWR